MSVEFVDADAHVVEAELTGECLRRWPEAFSLPTDGSPALLTEGRRYPEPTGPGAGCPPEHGLSTAEGINPFTPEGMLADAGSRIDTIVKTKIRDPSLAMKTDAKEAAASSVPPADGLNL